MEISKHLAVLCCFLAASLHVHSQGHIVPNGVTYGGYDNTFGYRVSVLHDPSNSNPVYSPDTQFWLNPIGKTQPTDCTNTFSFSQLADIEVRVFLISSNAPVSLQPILSQRYVELSLSSSYVFAAGVPFYVGLYTGANFAPPYPPNPPYNYIDPVFGWAQLVNNNGVIQMLGSALEYGGDGIYAGTQDIIQPVPEPSVLCLSVLGSLFVVWRRYRGVSKGVIKGSTHSLGHFRSWQRVE